MEREVGLPLRRHSGSGTSGEKPLQVEKQKGQTCRGSLTHELSIRTPFDSFVSGLDGRDAQRVPGCVGMGWGASQV